MSDSLGPSIATFTSGELLFILSENRENQRYQGNIIMYS